MTTLKQRDHVDVVRALQELLSRAGAAPPLGIDGDFGDAIEKAVRSA